MDDPRQSAAVRRLLKKMAENGELADSISVRRKPASRPIPRRAYRDSVFGSRKAPSERQVIASTGIGAPVPSGGFARAEGSCARQGLGYWAKVAHGKTVRRTSLPPATGQSNVIVIQGSSDHGAPHVSKGTEAEWIERESQPEYRVTANFTDEYRHPLVLATAARRLTAP
jgi:hypothetical protein